METDFLCTQAITDDFDDTNVDEETTDEEVERKQVALLKVLPNKKSGIPAIEFPVYVGENVIGRHTSSDISIPWSIALSKKHAIMEAEDDSIFVTDCGSSNKTRLGNAKLKPNVKYGLRNNDELVFGDVKCVIIFQNETIENTEVRNDSERNMTAGTGVATPKANPAILATDTPDQAKPVTAIAHETLNESTSTIPESQPVNRNTPISSCKSKTTKSFPLTSPSPFQIDDTINDADEDGDISILKQSTSVEDAENIFVPNVSHVADSDTDYHMDSDTDIEEDDKVTTNPKPSLSDGVYDADTAELVSGASTQIDQNVEANLPDGNGSGSDEDENGVSMIANLIPEQTQRIGTTSGQFPSPLALKSENIEEKSTSNGDATSKSDASQEQPGCSGLSLKSDHNQDEDILLSMEEDSFGDLCTQAFQPPKKIEELQDTMGLLETQAFGAKSKQAEDNSEEIEDSMLYDMPTQAFPRCLKSPEEAAAMTQKSFTIPEEENMPGVGDSVTEPSRAGEDSGSMDSLEDSDDILPSSSISHHPAPSEEDNSGFSQIPRIFPEETSAEDTEPPESSPVIHNGHGLIREDSSTPTLQRSRDATADVSTFLDVDPLSSDLNPVENDDNKEEHVDSQLEVTHDNEDLADVSTQACSTEMNFEDTNSTRNPPGNEIQSSPNDSVVEDAISQAQENVTGDVKDAKSSGDEGGEKEEDVMDVEAAGSPETNETGVDTDSCMRPETEPEQGLDAEFSTTEHTNIKTVSLQVEVKPTEGQEICNQNMVEDDDVEQGKEKQDRTQVTEQDIVQNQLLKNDESTEKVEPETEVGDALDAPEPMIQDQREVKVKESISTENDEKILRKDENENIVKVNLVDDGKSQNFPDVDTGNTAFHQTKSMGVVSSSVAIISEKDNDAVLNPEGSSFDGKEKAPLSVQIAESSSCHLQDTDTKSEPAVEDMSGNAEQCVQGNSHFSSNQQSQQGDGIMGKSNVQNVEKCDDETSVRNVPSINLEDITPMEMDGYPSDQITSENKDDLSKLEANSGIHAEIESNTGHVENDEVATTRDIENVSHTADDDSITTQMTPMEMDDTPGGQTTSENNDDLSKLEANSGIRAETESNISQVENGEVATTRDIEIVSHTADDDSIATQTYVKIVPKKCTVRLSLMSDESKTNEIKEERSIEELKVETDLIPTQTYVKINLERCDAKNEEVSDFISEETKDLPEISASSEFIDSEGATQVYVLKSPPEKSSEPTRTSGRVKRKDYSRIAKGTTVLSEDDSEPRNSKKKNTEVKPSSSNLALEEGNAAVSDRFSDSPVRMSKRKSKAVALENESKSKDTKKDHRSVGRMSHLDNDSTSPSHSLRDDIPEKGEPDSSAGGENSGYIAGTTVQEDEAPSRSLSKRRLKLQPEDSTSLLDASLEDFLDTTKIATRRSAKKRDDALIGVSSVAGTSRRKTRRNQKSEKLSPNEDETPVGSGSSSKKIRASSKKTASSEKNTIPLKNDVRISGDELNTEGTREVNLSSKVTQMSSRNTRSLRINRKDTKLNEDVVQFDPGTMDQEQVASSLSAGTSTKCSTTKLRSRSGKVVVGGGDVCSKNTEVPASKEPETSGELMDAPECDIPRRSRKQSGVKKGGGKVKKQNSKTNTVEKTNELSLPNTSEEATGIRSSGRKRRNASLSSTSSSSTIGSSGPAKRVKSDGAESEEITLTPRALRPKREKPKVMFTGVLDTTAEAVVTSLGGKLVTDINDCSHLVTDKMRRTVKFLCAVARGLQIVTMEWLHRSSTHSRFLPEDDYELSEEAHSTKGESIEKKYNFQLGKTLQCVRNSPKPLFHGLDIFVTKNVAPPPEQMNQILACAGARVLSKMPSDQGDNASCQNKVVIATPSDKLICTNAISAGCKVVTNEFVLTGILRHQVDYVSHELFGSCARYSEIGVSAGTPSIASNHPLELDSNQSRRERSAKRRSNRTRK